MLKAAVKGLAGSLGYDVMRRNSGGAATHTRGIVSRFEAAGANFAFFVANEWDYIQAHHLKGRLYEAEELALIRQHFTGGTIVDVGANVGNHAMYFLKVLGAERVIAFEPNPAAAELLAINAALNGVAGRLEHRALGLSDRAANGHLVAPGHKDLGSTRIAVADGEAVANGADGSTVPVETGDVALAGAGPIAMIKIDTEQMEMAVLAGLRETLRRWRPALFVEVDDVNQAAFDGFAESEGYRIAATHRRYATNRNHLIVPEPSA